MTRFDEAVAEARERAPYSVELKRSEPNPVDDAVAAAVAVSSQDGTALLVEIGTGPSGAYATVSAFSEGEPAEPDTFSAGTQVMVTVEGKEG